MKQTTVYSFVFLSTLLLISNLAFSQFNVQITVNSGSATTTCTDPLSAPDPLWSINIDNSGWVDYPAGGGCFTALPNVQFNQTYQCLTDIPPAIQVCFRAFENDPPLFSPCNIVPACLVETCINVPVPPMGSQNFTLQLPDNQASDGEASLTITSSGVPWGVNNAICNAIDFGELSIGTAVGLVDTSIFNNFCSDGSNEPTPAAFGIGWANNRGVWFKFTTSDSPGSHIRVTAKSDPSNFGDEVNLQVAIFTSDNGTCTGTFDFVTQNHEPVNYDETNVVTCPDPNTTYYILVDGVSDTPQEVEGYFGLEVVELGAQVVSDIRCEAEELGAVPLGGMVSTNGWRSNGCSMNSQPAPAMAFGVQKSVWLSFVAPPTGHVLINAISDTVDDPIGIQLSAFESSDNTCSGVFSELGSVYTANNLDETLELHCLEAGETYFVQIDGALAALNQGIFSLSVSDAGNETPVTNQNVTLCAGETLTVGTSIYSLSGNYQDTLEFANGCDSVVLTTLLILEPLTINLAVLEEGLGLGNTEGEAEVAPTGGTGNYSYLWSDGQTTALATGLVGGDLICVTVSDDNNCELDTCFEMPYFLHFEPTVQADSVSCKDGSNGTIRLTVSDGLPPYNYTWQNSDATLTGSGSITFDGEIVTFENLPADEYSFQIVDIYFDTTVLVSVFEPAEIAVTNALLSDASCFEACDGVLSIAVSGGTAPYTYLWTNGSTSPDLTDLCANAYELTVTDSKGCTGVFDWQINEPIQFLAFATEVKGVSCFEGSDGEAEVTSSGTAIEWIWSNGEVGPSIKNVPGGFYEVTVTNSDGCTASSSVTVSTPSAPVGASIVALEDIICKGDNSGFLQAEPSGPGATFTYLWSNGSVAPVIADLLAGNYGVTITNEKGCSATASFALTEPTEIQATFTPNKLTCLDEPDGGIVTIDGVSGGLEPYLFSTDGLTFSPENVLDGYFAGTQSFFVMDAGGCTKEFSATIEGPQELLLELGEDLQIDLGETVELQPSVNQQGLNYLWSPSENLSCADCPEPTVTPIQSGFYSLVVSDDFGCTASDQLFIEVNKKRKVYVPNAFSPDGDGINDEFVPFGGNDVVQVRAFKIFDRQGNMVYTADNFSPGEFSRGWDGYFRGKAMQPGVFVWFAEIEFLDKEVEVFKGDVTLLK